MLLYLEYDWASSFKLMSIWCALCAVASLVLPEANQRREHEDVRQHQTNSNSTQEEQIEDGHVSESSPLLNHSNGSNGNQRAFLFYRKADSWAVVAVYLPYTCLPSLAKGSGYTEVEGNLLVIAIGVGSTLGRGLAGVLLKSKIKSPLKFTWGATCAAAFFPLLCSLTINDCIFLVVFSFCFRSFSGFWISATQPALIEMRGRQELKEAMNKLQITRGIAALFGLAIMSAVAEAFTDQAVRFYASTGCFGIAIVFFSVAVSKCQ